MRRRRVQEKQGLPMRAVLRAFLETHETTQVDLSAETGVPRTSLNRYMADGHDLSGANIALLITWLLGSSEVPPVSEPRDRLPAYHINLPVNLHDARFLVPMLRHMASEIEAGQFDTAFSQENPEWRAITAERVKRFDQMAQRLSDAATKNRPPGRGAR